MILDTTVLVGRRAWRVRLDDLIGDEDDVAVAAVTIAELLGGVELADAAHQKRRAALVDSVIATVPVEDYDLDVARAHGRLLAHTHRTGRRRGAHDLVIAATALVRGRIVVTADEGGFADLPGIAVRFFLGSAEG